MIFFGIIENSIRVIQDNDFVTFILILGLVLIMILNWYYPNFIEKIFQLKNEDEENNYIVGGLLTLVLIANFSLLALPYIKPLTINVFISNTYIKFGFVYILILVFYMLKRVIFFIYHIILTNQDSYTFFVHLKIINSAWLIIFSLLIILYYYYSPFNKKYFMEITILIFTAIKLIEWTYYLAKNKIGGNLTWHYKILYLCTLEILPLIVIFKFLFIK